MFVMIYLEFLFTSCRIKNGGWQTDDIDFHELHGCVSSNVLLKLSKNMKLGYPGFRPKRPDPGFKPEPRVNSLICIVEPCQTYVVQQGILNQNKSPLILA